MAQLFAPGADALLRLAVLSGAALLAGGAVVVAGIARSDYVTGVGIAPAQPVPFSHKHHAGELGIDCRYCHTTVETQASAGLPPTQTCMTCHSQIWTGSDMLKPVRDSFASGEPLRWTRLNKLPQYVYYNHAVHVTKGIGCSTCHGDVTTMQMTFRANAFEMRFCLDCHRAPDRYVRPPDQVWNMNWSPPADQATRGPELVAKNHIHGGDRLTECGICHR
ncbi:MULTISPECIES: cytochrome c3 family protein [unclassified Methylobacterium]|uniref:cytochrome c3 family protein n=1 Tax=unclassified Methylobacterium TaxID=2615210 RepID=UPI0006F6BD8C|nr:MULTISPECIES: cytochrome c3 family protein [unclassified Methylobacterium]KQP72906.1 cytochrome C [Methylobacterium sp. Leaf113]MCK2055916.1 cytochrome c3 family protein [Methylobacterium sp. 37f]